MRTTGPSNFPHRPFLASIGAFLPGFPVELPPEQQTHPFRKRFFMSSELIQHVTDDSFEADVHKSDLPVLVDYWAEWCGPCKMIAPILEEVAKEYQGKLKVAKVNIDENQDTPRKFNIRGIPTLMLFKNGNIEATKVGAVSKSQLMAFIDSHL
jgi:thioredoxin 1